MEESPAYPRRIPPLTKRDTRSGRATFKLPENGTHYRPLAKSTLEHHHCGASLTCRVLPARISSSLHGEVPLVTYTHPDRHFESLSLPTAQ